MAQKDQEYESAEADIVTLKSKITESRKVQSSLEHQIEEVEGEIGALGRRLEGA